MKLPPAARKAVEEAMQRELYGLGFEEYVKDCLERDVQRAIASHQRFNPELQVDAFERDIRFSWILERPNGWFKRGVARRCTSGDLSEFALFIQMHVRQSILNHVENGDEYTDVWDLLPAIAIRDELAVNRYVEIATFPLTEGHPDTRTIYNGVHALLRSHEPELNLLAGKRPLKRSPAWIRGIILCLQGIAARDATRVASGIEQHLAGFRRGFRINPLEKIVSLDSHGLFRLAERIDPDLIEEVEENREPPWDKEFHAWSSTSRPGMALEHFGNCPAEYASALVTLEAPPWWRA